MSKTKQSSSREKSEVNLNDESLFGSLMSDSNLTSQENGNMIAVGDSDDSDDDNLVFENELPASEDESETEIAFDADAPTQMEKTPYNSIMSFGQQVGRSINSALSMSMPLQDGHYVSWKISKKTVGTSP